MILTAKSSSAQDFIFNFVKNTNEKIWNTIRFIKVPNTQ